MDRIIVENRTGGKCSDAQAMRLVGIVIEKGRVSDNGKCYCHVTSWPDYMVVYAKRNKRSDRFIVVYNYAPWNREEW